jgi:hypothetical protein
MSKAQNTANRGNDEIGYDRCAAHGRSEANRAAARLRRFVMIGDKGFSLTSQRHLALRGLANAQSAA